MSATRRRGLLRDLVRDQVRGRLPGLALALVALGCEAPSGPPTIENVLILMTEDQGAHAGYLGTPGVETPHMDRLAEAGASFPHAFAASPVCSPSKASLYTGRLPHEHGLTANTVDFMRPAEALTVAQQRHPLYGLYRLEPGVRTMIEIARDEGLYTGLTGKLHVAPNESFPFDRFLRTRGEPGDGAGAVADFIADAAARDRPWLLVHGIRPPHRPFPDSERADVGVDPAAVRPPGALPPTAPVRRDWAEYLAAVQEADAAIGSALAALEASGQAERTLVVFTSDHGPAFPRGKMSPYALGLRVPLVFAGPGVAPDSHEGVLVSLVDVLPTLGALLGWSLPADLSGRSLAPLLRGEADDAAYAGRTIYAELAHGIPRPERGMIERSVFDGRWHLIHRTRPQAPRIVNNDLRRFEKWGNRSYAETLRQRAAHPDAWRRLAEIDNARLGGRPPRVELYDWRADPDELRDRAGDPAHRDTVERLTEAARRFAAPPSAGAPDAPQ